MNDVEITVESGMKSSGRFTLSAGQVAIVTFADNIGSARVIKTGAGAVYATFDGSRPTVDGLHTLELPAGIAYVREESTRNSQPGPDVVSLIAEAEVSVRVERAD